MKTKKNYPPNRNKTREPKEIALKDMTAKERAIFKKSKIILSISKYKPVIIEL